MEGLGPRKQRRLAAGAILVAMLAAILAAALLTRSTGSSDTSSVTRSATTPTAFPHPHPLAKAGTYPIYGMTPKQVERFTGRPTKIQGGCWLFRPTVGTQDGQPAQFVGTMVVGFPGGRWVRLNRWVKLCFYEGQFSEMYQQIPINGQLLWRPWSPGGPTVDACADPSACVPP